MQGQKAQTRAGTEDTNSDRKYRQGQVKRAEDKNMRGSKEQKFPSLPHPLWSSHHITAPVPALATLLALDFGLNPVVHNNRHSCSLSHPPPHNVKKKAQWQPSHPLSKTSGVTSRPAQTSPSPGNIDEVTHVAASLEKQPGHGIINTSINQAMTRKTRLEHFSQVTSTKKLSCSYNPCTSDPFLPHQHTAPITVSTCPRPCPRTINTTVAPPTSPQHH
ncbi:hypothetical protein Pmani_025933 [Petrolisthes manimaculis]|uniref:Uncharacterized protein n=1 Tax=Petrolisthes manimaculis TaxID=1843537 RepID=A0AAE1TYD4_9EUCA|nr:hypothetical protein Pmani_025933 [Petrolisthes manimaculis]